MYDTNQLIDAYIFVAENDSNTPVHQENFWAYEAFDRIISESPADGYALILNTLNRSLSNKALSFLAAGPLEDLLAKHGAILIDQIEQDAKTNRFLREALSGVWKNTIPDDIWERVQKFAEARP